MTKYLNTDIETILFGKVPWGNLREAWLLDITTFVILIIIPISNNTILLIELIADMWEPNILKKKNKKKKQKRGGKRSALQDKPDFFIREMKNNPISNKKILLIELTADMWEPNIG